jgi:hypothetical protein
MITSLKAGSDICLKGIEYNIRKNGALTFLTQGARKVFVYKDGADKPMILNCKSDDDRIVTLHLMEAFRILPMHTIMLPMNSLNPYTQESSDKLEDKMFNEVTQSVEPLTNAPGQTIKVNLKVPKEADIPTGKTYQTEEEFYAEMGITKQ